MKRNCKVYIAALLILALSASLSAQGWTVSLGGNVTLSGGVAALFPRGSNLRPVIADQSDTDTGLRFPASGQLSWVVDSTQIILFSSTGSLYKASTYINFGTTAGTSGYGLRDNAGTIELKDSGGSWGSVISASIANVFSAIQTFTLAPVFSSATASRVLAVDSGKALTTSFASSSLTGSLTDETGSGVAVFATSPALVTPDLGVPTAVILTSGTGLPISTGLTGAGTGVLTALGVNVGSAGAVVVFNGALGTPSSGTLSSATGLPISTGLTGAGTGVLTALGVNVGSAGAVVVNGGALGTPSSGTLSSATGLPVSTGISGLGTGVATALAANTGGAGAFALYGGALGDATATTLGTGTVTFTNGAAHRGTTTSGNTWLLQAYDNDTGPAYVSFLTVTNGNSPSATFSVPAGGMTVNWQGTPVAFAYGGTGLSTAADDTTLVSSGAAWVASALANCTDTGGNHLNYTTATNAFSCGTSSSGGGANAALSNLASVAINTDLVFAFTPALLRQNTTDGSDNSVSKLCGGGATGVSRGSCIETNGNEVTTFGGRIRFFAGTGGEYDFYKQDGTTQMVNFDATTGSVYFPTVAGGSAGDYDACLTPVTFQLTNAGASSCIVSSKRFKDEIGPLAVSLDAIDLLRPIRYTYKELAVGETRKGEEDRRALPTPSGQVKTIHAGLYAEDMALVEQSLVSYEADGKTPRGINYEEYTALLTKWVQDLKAQNQKLTARVDALEAR